MTDRKGSTCSDSDVHALHKQWDELSCPICMDHPHNAVLLLCSSHDSGCRTYICDTSYRHSNCLDRFKKLRTNPGNNHSRSNSSLLDDYNRERQNHEETSLYSSTTESGTGGQRPRRNMMESHEDHSLEQNNSEMSVGLLETVEGVGSQSSNGHLDALGREGTDLLEYGRGHTTESNGIFKCPLCRGKVTGWKIVKEARQYLDLKSRSCSREACSFSGNYRELRRHARGVHPSTRPADAEPSRQRAWHQLERQREYGDILSAIRSAMPGAVVFGDYIIDNEDGNSHGRENNGSDEGSGPWWTTLFLFHMFRNPLSSMDESRSSSRSWRTHPRTSGHRNLWGENLLGLQDDDDDDLDLEIPIPRRRRRITRPRRDQELP